MKYLVRPKNQIKQVKLEPIVNRCESCQEQIIKDDLIKTHIHI
jgi:hypothetical protein